MLGRLIAYSEKIFGLAEQILAAIPDRREKPRIPTIGRVQAGVNCQQIRWGLHRVYERLKRNKALPLNLGRDVAVLDGQESHASYRRRCAGCWQRKVETKQGARVQYYHRNVTLMLLPGALPERAPLRWLLPVTFWARLIAAEIYLDAGCTRLRSPP